MKHQTRVNEFWLLHAKHGEICVSTIMLYKLNTVSVKHAKLVIGISYFLLLAAG